MTNTTNLRPADPSVTRIGWIGTGIMGSSMCGHLMDAGYAMTVYNRSKLKAEPLLARGATWADTPRDVAQASDVVFTIVGFPKDVREVYFGADGVFAGAGTGAVLVDMTTNSPSLAVEIADKAEDAGMFALDAPVSGGDVGARNAALSIMVGGAPEVFEAVRPLFGAMGKTIVHQGPAGSGQHAKMCNQIVIAGHMIGVCESLLYAVRAGLEPSRVLESIATGAAACPALNNLWPRILKDDYAPGFIIDHFIKDMGIVVEESKRMGFRLKGLMLVEEIYREAQAMGFGSNGTQALYLALQKIAED
ncbi:NAD(P)-dependent oxidoreductase [Fundidesulfovibrio agrisoli]|uniref:NAD(P)-dependent oxidoreductase n=1 Tax=Fundidesulfovibrio agrisoli TaxID=2922717 RepID=UPI001FAD2F8F|nr:NAD(P)-dependent oxidoreductase [Fundidesulfovibrio agrisoli]